MVEGKMAIARSTAVMGAILAAGMIAPPVIAAPKAKAHATKVQPVRGPVVASQPVKAAPAPLPVVPAAPPTARPIGNPGEWFPRDSYPPAAKAAGQEGRTQFSVDIDAAGRITGCNIIQSSGSELLDSTTCIQLISNGRFSPARDTNGKPVAGTWSSAMRWALKEPVETEE